MKASLILAGLCLCLFYIVAAEAAITMTIEDTDLIPSIGLDGEGNFFDSDEVVVAVDFTRAATDTITSFDVKIDFPIDKLQVSRWSTLRCSTNTWTQEVSYDNAKGKFRFAAADATGLTGATPTAGVVVYIILDCSNMYPADYPRLDYVLTANSGTDFDEVAYVIFDDDNFVYGNLTDDLDPSALDAAFALKAVVGDLDLAAFGNWARALVEVSGDGQLTAYDASLILQEVAGTITQFPIATADRPAPKLLPLLDTVVTLDKFQEDPGVIGSLVFSGGLSIDSLAGVYGAEFYFEVDSQVRIVAVRPIEALTNTGVSWEYGIKDGRLVIALARTNPKDITGRLFDIQFSASLLADLVNPVRLTRVRLNEDRIIAKIESEPFRSFGSVAGNRLYPNYPNPFNPETWIPFRLAVDQEVTIRIFDSLGHQIKVFDLGRKVAGYYINKSRAVYWDGRNEAGEQVASGVYIYQLTAGEFRASRKMIVLK